MRPTHCILLHAGPVVPLLIATASGDADHGKVSGAVTDQYETLGAGDAAGRRGPNGSRLAHWGTATVDTGANASLTSGAAVCSLQGGGDFRANQYQIGKDSIVTRSRGADATAASCGYRGTLVSIGISIGISIDDQGKGRASRTSTGDTAADRRHFGSNTTGNGQGVPHRGRVSSPQQRQYGIEFDREPERHQTFPDVLRRRRRAGAPRALNGRLGPARPRCRPHRENGRPCPNYFPLPSIRFPSGFTR